MNCLAQKTLSGKTLKLPKTKEEIDEVCCEACYSALEKECRCKCHGAYHGLGKHALPDKGVSGEFALAEEEASRFRVQITTTKCRWCGASLENQPIMAYGPHSGGWNVEGYDQPLWLSIKCPNLKCGFDYSLWKLGVLRDNV
jgi:hypothetical protein